MQGVVMTEINRIYGNSGVRPIRTECHPVPSDRKAAQTDGQDQVEISEVARLLNKLAEMPEIRMEKVEQVRAAIARGDYETPDKIEAVVERLLEQFRLEELFG